MVLVESDLNSEQFPLMRPIYIENYIFVTETRLYSAKIFLTIPGIQFFEYQHACKLFFIQITFSCYGLHLLTHNNNWWTL